MAYDRTVEVDSYEKMDWIPSKRSDIALYRSSVQNIFSRVFLHFATIFKNPNRLSVVSLQCCEAFSQGASFFFFFFFFLIGRAKLNLVISFLD